MPLMQMPPLAQNAIEPMQVDAPIEDNDNNEEHQVIVENPTLDLEIYANSYAGLARLHRLMFVADVCPALRIEALKMAISCVLSTYNVTLYQVLHKKLNETLVGSTGGGGGANAAGAVAANNGAVNAQAGGGGGGANGVAGGGGGAPIVLPGGAYLMSVGGPLPDIAVAAQPAAAIAAAVAANAQGQDLPVFDPAWVEAKSKKAALKLEKLDSDLKNYKSNSIKESIRRGQDDLGDHYLSCGDLSNALKCYSRARDYCTSGKHVVNMCLNVIKVSLYLQNWSHVLSYVSKAESTPDFAEHSKEANQSVYTRLKCAAGIAELQTRKYKSAAKHFLAANFDHCDFPEMISANNVAMYGGLCALATFERHELQKNVITSSSFKLFLELEPQLRDIIFKFYESKYASCLRLLMEIRENLLLDMYIAPHVTALYTKIRNRALIQYFSPYLSADMRKMAEAFNCTVPALENEVMQLILDGQIQARIDSHNKVLYAKEADQRSTTYERAMQMGKDYQRRSRMLILRAAMLRSRIHVKNIQRGGETGNLGGVATGGTGGGSNSGVGGGGVSVGVGTGGGGSSDMCVAAPAGSSTTTTTSSSSSSSTTTTSTRNH